MRAEDLDRAAADFRNWVLQGATFIRDHTEQVDGVPALPDHIIRDLEDQVNSLSPGACKLALTAALVALAGRL